MTWVCARQCPCTVAHGVHGEGVPGGDIKQYQQADEHEHRAAHGVEHEVECRLVTTLAAPATDEEEQRDQRQFPEQVEQRPVLGHEDAEHGGFQQQHQHEIPFRPLADAGRGEDADKAEQCRQQDHGEGNAVDAERIGGPEAWIPGGLLGKLQGGRAGLEDRQQAPGKQQGCRRGGQGHRADDAQLLSGQHGDQRGAESR